MRPRAKRCDVRAHKELAIRLHLTVAHIQHMFDYIQHTRGHRLIRSQYSLDALPDWVGRIEGNVSYEDILKSKGIDIGDSASMDEDVCVSSDDRDDHGDKDADDIAAGTPLQGSTTGDVDPEMRHDADGRGRTRTDARSRTQQQDAARALEVHIKRNGL